MTIITYKSQFVQAEIAPTTHETQTIYSFPPFAASSDVRSSAYELYDMGLNVVPQPRGQKAGYPWKQLQYTRLNRDDGEYGLDSLFAGECNLAVMCGATSGNLFIIDCESSSALAYHLGQLRQHGIPLWVVRTPRGGHIYLQAHEGEVHNVEPGIITETEIRGQHGYVLAPPSVHPTGAMYTWLVRETAEIPQVSVHDIDWLATPTGNPIQLEATPPSQSHTKGNWSYRVISPSSNLSNCTRDYIQNGYRISEGSRNNRLFAAACDMYGNGYTQHDVESILSPIALASGLPRYEVDRTINSALSGTRTPSRPEVKPLTDNTTWHYALLWAANRPWQGRRGATTRALCLALIERARLAANEYGVFRASIRELAVLARLGTNTVRKMLFHFEGDNIIQKCEQDRTSGASLWRFSDSIINIGKQLELNMDTVGVPPHWLRYSVFLFNSDTSERGALGHSVAFVYQYLRGVETPMMPSEIAEVLGLTVNQVNYALRKLRGFDLLRRLPTGWVVVGLTVTEFEAQVLSKSSVSGKGAARAARFQVERELFIGWRILNVRLGREKDAFAEAVKFITRCRELLEDPLLALALELGGVVYLDDGTPVILESSL